MAYAVKTQGLTKQYKTALAVDNVNLEVPVGCCCGFLGKNGAGKTTTIKMLVGLKRPTSGQISIMGQEQHFGEQTSLPFGYLPDVPNFYGYMTGEEFLDLCGKLCKLPTGERKTRVKALLKQVGLDNTRTRISGYSRGMKQRLGIAQAMINDPPVIYMDEPVSALDPIGRKDVMEIMQSMTDTTVIFSTHILADVENVCDYVLIIEKGRILAQDYMHSLKEKYSENAAKIRFYNQEDARKFVSGGVGDGSLLTVSQEGVSPTEAVIRGMSGNTQELSRYAVSVLHGLGLAFEAFESYTPTLESIFYEVISNV